MYEAKITLRKKIRKDISSLTEEYISLSNSGIYRNVTTMERFIDARNIMIYYSVEREPATHDIAQAALNMGKTVAFPLCYQEGVMDARIVSSFTNFDTSSSIIGIPSPSDTAPCIPPEDLDLIIVPALAFDQNGFRLGLGGGYYDRFLYGLHAYTIGLARECLLQDTLPTEPHDVRVNCIVTEKSIFTFAS